MGKKVKKNARSGHKEKGLPPASPKKVPQQGIGSGETPTAERVLVVKERGVCSHIDGGINVEKISAKLQSAELLKCEDCRENAMDRRANKGKGKHGKKGGIKSKSDLKAIWICLECGHFSCGGVGFPTTPQSHAVRHAKQSHHPLAMQFENSQLLWCFPCDNLVASKRREDSGEHKDLINEIAKMLKAQSGGGSTLNVENVWFGSGSGSGEIMPEHSASIRVDERAGHSVRGLINLGNTCFFNSTLQNLLALNKFRDRLFKFDESVGPLIASLRKLFLETGAEAGSKSVISPRSLFGCLCNKAPQFRGYQQHDSHELLRCLLDGLCTEELIARKHVKSSLDNGAESVADPTFIDAIFGGQLSSTVSCMECGHSSAIYEPFLDLSLPIPSKKPPSKRPQPAIRGKKPKLPPKRGGRVHCREQYTLPEAGASTQSTVGNSSGDVQSGLQPASHLEISSGDLASSAPVDLNETVNDLGFTAGDLSGIQQLKNHQPTDNEGEQSVSSDTLTWLDYLEPNQVLDGNDDASPSCEISKNLVSTNENVYENNDQLSKNLDSNVANDFVRSTSETSLESGNQFNSFEPGMSVCEDVSQSEEKQQEISRADEKLSKEEFFTKENAQHDTDLVCGSESCAHILNDSNLDACSSGRHAEKPPRIHSSEVILLPYTEDVSSSCDPLRVETEGSSAVVGDEPGSMEFDGFGDLFNEPEVSSELGPSVNSSAANGIVKDGVAGNSSDSDPNEVDNTDKPVSVESCLAFFTKPELLSKDEHAWQCDNCSKVLRKQVKSRKFKKSMKKMELIGCDIRNPNGLLDVGKNMGEPKDVNGTVENDGCDAFCERSLTHNRQNDENRHSILINHSETERNVIPCQPENIKPRAVNSCHDLSECSSNSSRTLHSCSGKCDTDHVGHSETDLSAQKCESEVSEEEEEAESESFKVSRDATKSLLISKAPSVLTIHLKRFSQDSRGRLSKLNGHVHFKEIIDLKPYMNPRNMNGEKYVYHLVGAVEHQGSMRGGHYVAYVKGGGERYGDNAWYHASDAHVRQASLDEVLRCDAYILFYEGT